MTNKTTANPPAGTPYALSRLSIALKSRPRAALEASRLKEMLERPAVTTLVAQCVATAHRLPAKVSAQRPVARPSESRRPSADA